MILKEFLKSDTICDLIVVTNQDKEKAFFNILKSKIPFEQDNRIKFVGTVYDKEILSWLRQKARGYINGHTMGGTNPGLLEGLATTNVNLVRDCPFSREGADDTAFYFDENHPMSELIAKVDAMPMEERIEIGIRAKKRMSEQFSWSQVNEKYIELFNDIQKDRVEKA
jgi:rhamnosyltransferase